MPENARHHRRPASISDPAASVLGWVQRRAIMLDAFAMVSPLARWFAVAFAPYEAPSLTTALRERGDQLVLEARGRLGMCRHPRGLAVAMVVPLFAPCTGGRTGRPSPHGPLAAPLKSRPAVAPSPLGRAGRPAVGVVGRRRHVGCVPHAGGIPRPQRAVARATAPP